MSLPVCAAPGVGSTLPVPLPAPSNFPAYARMANQVPMLDAARERTLVQAWRDHADPLAARDLVLAHLRLVVKVVRDHRGYGLSQADLAQEGTVGLMRAVHGFDPAVGVRLAAYATRWIEAEVREFIFRNYRLVRMGGSAAMKKLFFGYRHTLQSLKAMGAERPAGVGPAQVAQALGVSEEQARQAQAYFAGRDMALDGPGEPGQEGGDDVLMLAALPADPPTPALLLEHQRGEQDIASAVHQALARLPERDRDVIQARRLDSPPQGLAQLGQRWGISAERVRQIEQRAAARLRRELERAGAQDLLQ